MDRSESVDDSWSDDDVLTISSDKGVSSICASNGNGSHVNVPADGDSPEEVVAIDIPVKDVAAWDVTASDTPTLDNVIEEVLGEDIGGSIY